MGVVKIKWTDPPDILTNEPVPCTWAGTVVVRKEGSAPRHRWDGTLIVDSTTRDEYSSSALADNTIQSNKVYYYGIFPYDTKGDYRFTKCVVVTTHINGNYAFKETISTYMEVNMENELINTETDESRVWEEVTEAAETGNKSDSLTFTETITVERI